MPSSLIDAFARHHEDVDLPCPLIELPGLCTGAVTEARAVMWRSRLADKRALLILDNAASYRQLEPLLPVGAAVSSW
ncbi:hypothetical protein ACFU8W_50910 [Streptomyces sp. NPDC057565]|uniref:hypothetical protein n=1 Tax=Streptomyces sp. NPDC057565 TaxID=3346169 RepID=UPI0036A94BDB